MTDHQRQQIIDDTMTYDAIERYKERLHALCRRVEEAVREDHSGEANEMIPAFKVDTLEDIFDALCLENPQAISNAIDAHVRAIALSLLDGKGAEDA